MGEPTRDQFLKDVERHKMSVKLSDGVYRHLRFSKPLDSNMWFELVTWPGYLTISGDMGTWAFSRITDMFEFFRSRNDGELEINSGYWSEKLQAGASGGSRHSKVWDSDKFSTQL